MYSMENNLRMDLPLQLTQNEAASMASRHVAPEINKPEDCAFDDNTEIIFMPKDASRSLINPTASRSFELDDTEQLKVFYSKRLEFISKSVLVRITSCWYQRRALRGTSKRCKVNSSRSHLSGKQKEGEYHQSATFPCYLLPSDIVSEAVDLLLHGGATEYNRASSSWIMDLENHTKPVVDKISPGQFSRNDVVKPFVRSNVLPSLFYVAKRYEDLCQPMSNDSPFRYKAVVQWSEYYIPKRLKVKQEDTADGNVLLLPVQEASMTRYDSTVHRPNDSPTPDYSPIKFENQHAAHNLHEGEIVRASVQMVFGPSSAVTPIRLQQLECQSAKQHPTVEHKDANHTVATDLQSTNTTLYAAAQLDYTSSFNSDWTGYSTTSSAMGLTFWPCDTMSTQSALRDQEGVQIPGYDHPPLLERYTTPYPHNYLPRIDITDATTYLYGGPHHPTPLLATGANMNEPNDTSFASLQSPTRCNWSTASTFFDEI
jgi:hypothetical protein